MSASDCANGLLYATRRTRFFALDAATGIERWSFDPNEVRKTLGDTQSASLTGSRR